jgi:hypothetical protein
VCVTWAPGRELRLSLISRISTRMSSPQPLALLEFKSNYKATLVPHNILPPIIPLSNKDSQNIWDLHQLAVTASVCEFSFFLSFFYTILIQHRSDRGSIVNWSPSASSSASYGYNPNSDRSSIINWSQTASSSLLLYRFGFVLLLFLSFSPWSCIILARLWSTHHRAIMLCVTPSFKVTLLELVLQQS